MYDGYAPQHSPDRALTAFAQLSTLRLNVRRSIISLIDSANQYILTEATRTLSLSRHTIDKEDDRLWLGKAVLPRGDGLCDNIFGSTYTATDEDGSTYTSDAFVVSDMSKHPVLCTKPFVVGQPGVRFYAGVPMRTRGGHIIGVYACSHNQPRNGLTVAEFKFLEDMAETVMEHLEMVRDREDRSRGERMVRGLAEFIEGSCSLGMDPTENSTTPGVNGTPSSKVLETQTQNIRSMEDGEGPPKTISGPKASKRIKEPEPSNPNCIFYRAANLIRKSTFAGKSLHG
jgi:GAF domain